MQDNIENRIRFSSILTVDRLFLYLICLLTLSLTGCDENKTVTLDSAFRDYSAGRYQVAYSNAKSFTRGANKEEANFIAGLSAYRLGRAPDAITHLRAVSDANDRKIHATANSTLGLVYEGMGQYQSALRYYQKSLKFAENEDLARTHYQMGIIQQKQGQWSSATSHFSLAISATRSLAFKQLAQQKLNATGFTIQLGAYASRKNANARALKVSSISKRNGYGEPRIVLSKTNQGQTRYLVQVGRFSTFASARSAQRRLGQTDSAVMALTK